MDTIVLNGVEYVAKSDIPVIEKVMGTPIGEYCIVRCRDSGVWAGFVVAKEGRDATLREARRLWSWKAAKGFTLSGVALHGLGDGKLSSPVPVVYLTETCEFIPVSPVAKESIVGRASHNE